MEIKAPIESINYSTREAAMYIGFCKSSLDKSRVSGELFGQKPPPFLKMGRSIRYRVEDLNAWVKCQETFESLAEAEAYKYQ
ncbi:helix-turn-helix transcriptional regulator [Endozoicomonas ascidiicola]|uniref:helix-turn-helix transcriptional regulator n=1 Tax=Endozoicomonas ascidiicola TaxID=1698521 RepID=UPI0008377D32|nr:helix-turn-helix domain-containing protein [Endozoicomonas ascidiicola]